MRYDSKAVQNCCEQLERSVTAAVDSTDQGELRMRLYILRHGETDWNKELRLQGQTDISLNEKGRQLARVTGDALREITFDLVISSPLSRAVETAKLVLGGRDIPILLDKRIQEIGFGVMEGGQVRNAAGEITDDSFYNFFYDPGKYEPQEGGESIHDLRARTGAFLEELKTQTEWRDKTILVSTHGAAVRSLQSNINSRELKDFWAGGVPQNCAVSIVDLEDNQWIIKEQDKIYYENI